MKATRKSVIRARASGGVLVALALMVPLGTQAQPEPAKNEKPVAANPGQAQKGQGQAPPAQGSAKPAAKNPYAVKTTASPNAGDPPGKTKERTTASPNAGDPPGKTKERTTGPERAGRAPGPGAPGATPPRSPEAEARRAELEKRRRERTLASYNKAFEELHPPPGGEEPPAAQRKKIKRQFDSAKRRILAMHRMDARRYEAMDKPARAAIEAKVEAFEKKLAADREARAEKERATIKASLGDKVTAKPVKNELRQHAWRIARLNHLLAMAEARDHKQGVEQAKMLIKKENERHTKAVARLKTMKLADKNDDKNQAPQAGANAKPPAAPQPAGNSPTAPPAAPKGDVK